MADYFAKHAPSVSGPAVDAFDLTWTGSNIVFSALAFGNDVVRAVHNYGTAGVIKLRCSASQRTVTFYVGQGGETPAGHYDAVIASGTTAQSLTALV